MKRTVYLILAVFVAFVHLNAAPKTFKDKKYVTREGVVRLHKAEGRMYMEFPVSLIGRRMLMGTIITRCSDPMESSAGYRPVPPAMVCFERSDSSVFLCSLDDSYVAGAGAAADAVSDSHIPSIMESFRIKEFTEDSTFLLIDISNFVKREDKSVNPIDPKAYNGADGYVKRSSTHISSATYISGFDSFEDNFSISVSHSYKVKAAFLGVFSSDERTYMTSEVKRTFMLLPEESMKPRRADVRIGTDRVAVNEISDSQRGVNRIEYATRWRLQADSLGNVLNPIMFYIDSSFPANWIPYVEKSVAAWNGAFVRLGYHNAVLSKVFPDDEPDFDPGNMKYSCIRYNFSLSDHIYDNKYSDPRTGEILSAGIYVNHGICETIRRGLMLQTGAGLESVRGAVIDDELFGRILTSRMMRHIGHCLGLKDNMAASYAYPVDSLKSSTFTSENGIASSVMDELPYNFIAYSSVPESEPKNGELPAIVQEGLGPYDYHTISWLYGNDSDISGIDLNSPLLRYGKRQSPKAFYDPRAMALDLGDNSLESAEYAFDGLADVVASIDGWAEEFDKDYSFRRSIQEPIILQAYEYMKQVFVPLGGIYLNAKLAGDNVRAYSAVPRDVQRNHLLWAMEKIDDLSFLDSVPLDRNMSLTGSTAEYCSKYFSNFIFIQIGQMWKSEKCSENPYTEIDAMKDVRQHVWRGARSGVMPTDLQKFQQGLYVDALIAWSGVAAGSDENADPYRPDRSHTWYGMLLETQELLASASRAAKSEDAKGHYDYLSYRIRKVLKKK